MSRLFSHLVDNWGQSPHALRLGSALLHFLWQGAALAIVGWLVLVALKRSRPNIRYGMMVYLLAAMAACPIVTFFAADVQLDHPAASQIGGMVPSVGEDGPLTIAVGPALSMPPEPVAAPSITTDRPRGPTPASAPAVPPATVGTIVWTERLAAAEGWLGRHRQWFVAAWLAGVVLLSLRLAVGLMGAERARRRGVVPSTEPIRQLVATLAVRMGLRQSVQVVESALAEVPTLVGWLRPVILLPASALCGLTPSQLEAILAHELAHVRRNDYLVNLIQTVVETVLFYHPAVWWLSTRIRHERELCCDDIAMALCSDRVGYARALVALEELRWTPPQWVVAAGGGSLAARIRRLVGRPETERAGTPAFAAVAAIVLLVGTVCFHRFPAIAADEPKSEKPNTAEAKEGTQESAKKRDDAKARTPWSVFGKVTDGHGKPLAGVVVTAHAGYGTLHQTGKAETDAEGKYAFNFGPGIAFANNDVQLQAATIAARKSGSFEKNQSRQGDLAAALKLPEGDLNWGKKTKDDVILPGKPREINFVMLPAARMAGMLIGDDDKPLAGYSVSLKGPVLPPSSSVAASTKTDEGGRFALGDVPTGYKWQILVEPAKREPPWNAWASGLYEFGPAGGDELFILRNGEELAANRFELKVTGTGVNWKQALAEGADNQKLDITGDSLTGKSRLHAASVRLVLSTPAGDKPKPAREPAAAKADGAVAASKSNLRITAPDAEGRFSVLFDNPLTKQDTSRWTLDPKKHQVIFQVFAKDAAGKLVSKELKKIAAREAGGYRVEAHVPSELFETSTLAIVFVTIQPEHDQWVSDFFGRGKKTTYKGIWSTDSSPLKSLPREDPPATK